MPEQSLELIKANINLELTKSGLEYQKLLQQAENIKFSKDTLNQDYEPLKKLREVATKIKNMENPNTKAWQDWNEARKSLADPINKVLAEKTKEFSNVAAQIEADKKKQKDEADRVAAIKDKMNNFFMDQAQAIAGATTNQELLSIEREINLEKTRVKTYQEFIPLLIGKSVALTELLANQKQKVKELEKLTKQAAEANEKQDDATLLDLMEQKEYVNLELNENKVKVQEAAINQATDSEVIEPEIELPNAPKARKTQWKYELVNKEQALKLRPDLLDISLNPEGAKEVLSNLKATGILNGKTEHLMYGIRFYEEKLF